MEKIEVDKFHDTLSFKKFAIFKNDPTYILVENESYDAGNVVPKQTSITSDKKLNTDKLVT